MVERHRPLATLLTMSLWVVRIVFLFLCILGGFAVSQVKRKLVEEGFGWGKTIGGLRKLHHRGQEKVGWSFAFTNAAYNLVRIRTLIRAGVCA